MKKEVFLAISIGVVFGLLITFGLYTARKSIKEAGQIVSFLVENKNGSTSPPAITSSLSLLSPIDQSISKEGKTSIVGSTAPLAWIIILTETGEKMIQADEKGSFSTEVFLVSGENEIEVKSMSDKGEIISKTITVVYSTAEI